MFGEFNPNIYFGGDNVIFWGPLAWTVIYGLLIATFLTLIIVPVSVICWLTATFLTKPESKEVLNRFYQKVCPGGWWRGIDPSFIKPEKSVLNFRFVINWFAGILFVFGATLGLGYLIFQSYTKGLVCILLSVVGGAVIWNNVKKI